MGGTDEHSSFSSTREEDAEPPMSPEEIQKEMDRYKRKQELHEEIEQKLKSVLSKMVQAYPTPGDQSVPDFTLAIEKFNEWKAKVTAEVVENIRRIDLLSRQLHDTLAYGHKLLEEQSKEGTQVITQLVHASIADKEKQSTTSQKVEECRAYQDQLRTLLRRAEEREEELLRIELEERVKRDEERRQQAEHRRMASPRYNMTEDEAMRAAEMEVEKYKRQQELDPRIHEAKRKALLQKQQEAESEMRVEFPEEALNVTHPRSIGAVHMTELSPAESPFDDDTPAVEHFPPSSFDFRMESSFRSTPAAANDEARTEETDENETQSPPEPVIEQPNGEPSFEFEEQLNVEQAFEPSEENAEPDYNKEQVPMDLDQPSAEDDATITPTNVDELAEDSLPEESSSTPDELEE